MRIFWSGTSFFLCVYALITLLFVSVMTDAFAEARSTVANHADRERAEGAIAPRVVPPSQSDGTRSGDKWIEPAEAASRRNAKRDKVWRGKELNLLAVGMGVGDVTGDDNNDIVLIDPDTVYLYRFADNQMTLQTEYSERAMEFKSVDVAGIRKRGPARIYITAQNRGALSSFVLEYRKGKLVPVIRGVPYFLRVIDYPTQGPILLGQQKGIHRVYDGFIMRMQDKGDALEPVGRFGTPAKIPIFGFAIGDLDGSRKPVIAVYDRDEHLRLYKPSGKRIFLSRDYYGGSDVIIRKTGPESRVDRQAYDVEEGREYFRPRITTQDFGKSGIYEILAITHVSKTRRYFSRMKMLGEGRVVSLKWNGDTLVKEWSTPSIQGMITDFAVAKLSGLPGKRLITVERKKTDWLSFLRSRSQIRAYDLDFLRKQGTGSEPEPESE